MLLAFGVKAMINNNKNNNNKNVNKEIRLIYNFKLLSL